MPILMLRSLVLVSDNFNIASNGEWESIFRWIVLTSEDKTLMVFIGRSSMSSDNCWHHSRVLHQNLRGKVVQIKVFKGKIKIVIYRIVINSAFRGY